MIPVNIPTWLLEPAHNFQSKTAASGHRVYQVADGVFYPSVTTVLGLANVEKQAGLARWREAVGKDKASKVTEDATTRGTAVHDMLDNWLDDSSVDVDTKDLAKEVAVPFRQVRKLLLEHLSEIIIKEQCLVSHSLKTAGRTDLMGVWKGRKAFIDFKTANKSKSESEINDYFLQATIYALCWYEMTGELVEDIVIIIGNQNLFKPQVFERKIQPYIKNVLITFDNYNKLHKPHEPTTTKNKVAVSNI